MLRYVLILAVGMWVNSNLLSAEVTIEDVGEGRYRVKVDGGLFAEYIYEGFSKPLIYPIHNASGVGMTRDWPVIQNGREGEEHDHKHHKSLFVGHQGINGTDFWHEGSAGCGTVEHVKTIALGSGDREALLKSRNIWKDAAGKSIFSEVRTMKFGELEGIRYIDLTLVLKASRGEVTFQEFKDGFVGIRTHPHLRLSAKPKHGVTDVYGHAKNSEAVIGPEIWGQKADWVHYWGKIDGADAGFAFMSHPSNLRSPTWWHAREYGLVAANPFARAVDGGYGEYVLSEGKALTLRYRFIFHGFSEDEVDISEQYHAFIQAEGAS